MAAGVLAIAGHTAAAGYPEAGAATLGSAAGGLTAAKAAATRNAARGAAAGGHPSCYRDYRQRFSSKRRHSTWGGDRWR